MVVGILFAIFVVLVVVASVLLSHSGRSRLVLVVGLSFVAVAGAAAIVLVLEGLTPSDLEVPLALHPWILLGVIGLALVFAAGVFFGMLFGERGRKA